MRLFQVTRAMDAAIGFEPGRQLLRAVVAPLDEGGAAAMGEAPPGSGWFRLAPPAPGAGPREAVYFAGLFEWQTLFLKLLRMEGGPRLGFLSPADSRAALAAPGMPPRLGWNRADPFVPLEAQLASVRRRDGAPARIAVVNLFHTAFGDAILCRTMLRELRARLEACLGEVRLELFQNRYHPEVHALYEQAPEVDAIHALPAPLARLAACDGWFDLTDDPVPAGTPWIDACLEAVGIAPASVPPGRKRNRLAVSAGAARALEPAVRAARSKGAPLLLVHPAASTPIRSIPPARVAPLLDAILARTGWTVACAVPTGYAHPRFVDWSGLSASFADFVYLASQADLVLSVDTSLYHVADAFGVPGAVLFTSIDPGERIGYYPFLAGIRVGDAATLAGRHRSDHPDDVAQAESLWDALDVDAVIAAIEAMAHKRADALQGSPPD